MSRGIFAAALVPEQRDSGTRKLFCPGTKGQRDVPSWIVPEHPLETLIQTKQDRKRGMLGSAMIKAGLSCNHYMIFCYNNDSITLLP